MTSKSLATVKMTVCLRCKEITSSLLSFDLTWHESNSMLHGCVSFWKVLLHLQLSRENMVEARHHVAITQKLITLSMSLPPLLLLLRSSLISKPHIHLLSHGQLYAHIHAHTHTYTFTHSYFPYLPSKLKPPRLPKPQRSPMSGCLNCSCHFSH